MLYFTISFDMSSTAKGIFLNNSSIISIIHYGTNNIDSGFILCKPFLLLHIRQCLCDKHAL